MPSRSIPSFGQGRLLSDRIDFIVYTFRMKNRLLFLAFFFIAVSAFGQNLSKGKVVVYRLKFAIISTHIDSAPVWVDGKKVVDIDHHRHAVLELAPGKHEFRSGDKLVPIILNVEGGKTYYLREDYGMRVTNFKGQQVLVQMDDDTAVEQCKKTKPVEPKRIYDPLVVEGL